MTRIRLLPLVILFCFTTLVVRGVEIGMKGNYITLPLFFQNMQLEPVGSAQAEGSDKKAEPAKKKADKKDKEKDGEKKEDKEADKSDKGEKKDNKKDDKKEGDAEEEGDNASKEPPAPTYSAYELELLKNLSVRREELERWEKKLIDREHMAEATDTKLNNRLEELKALKTEVEGLLKVYNEKEDLKIRSLVKIYENMKPKEAARIFEQMDMEVLLQVIDKMKEAVVAPILANMSPEKAKDITEKMAKERKLSVAEETPPTP